MPERYASRHDDHLVLREMIDEVMFEIRSMTGQEYRNVYSSKGSSPSRRPLESANQGNSDASQT
jgi:hypothetical protein